MALRAIQAETRRVTVETVIGNAIGLLIGLTVGGVVVWVTISLIEKRYRK